MDLYKSAGFLGLGDVAFYESYGLFEQVVEYINHLLGGFSNERYVVSEIRYILQCHGDCNYRECKNEKPAEKSTEIIGKILTRALNLTFEADASCLGSCDCFAVHERASEKEEGNRSTYAIEQPHSGISHLIVADAFRQHKKAGKPEDYCIDESILKPLLNSGFSLTDFTTDCLGVIGAPPPLLDSISHLECNGINVIGEIFGILLGLLRHLGTDFGEVVVSHIWRPPLIKNDRHNSCLLKSIVLIYIIP